MYIYNFVMERGGVNNVILISEVNKRRSLWDQKSLDYNNRALKSKDWESVAEVLDTSVDEVKNRWKLLKDSYNHEVRNLKHNSNSPKWEHFEHMSFLLSGTNSLLLPTAYLAHVETDNLSNASSCDNESLEESVYSNEERLSPPSKKKKINHNSAQSVNLSTHFHPPSNASKILGSNMLQSTPSIEWNEQGTSRPEHSNADYLFLMSLLPTFEKMSPRQKMLLKIKMMQDMYNVTFNDSGDSINNSSDSGFNSMSSGS